MNKMTGQVDELPQHCKMLSISQYVYYRGGTNPR